MLLPNLNQFWSLISILAIGQTFIPAELRFLVQRHCENLWSRLCRRFHQDTVVEVHEDLNDGFRVNVFYRQVELYLGSLEKIKDTDYLRISRSSDTSRFSFSLPPDETIEDTFRGAQLLWTHHATQKPEAQRQQMWWNYSGRRDSSRESKRFSLKLLKSDRARLLSAYFDHISNVAAQIERRDTQRKLHTNVSQDWEEVKFNHPSTFDTLALPPELKERIKSDLKAFSEGEVYYHRVGRAWKRGYLLYGPPGTGKSSMIAAMANFLHYDIYDLELTNVTDNSDLKSLLIRTTRKSIIVIEDIDCSLDLSDRAAKLPDKAAQKEATVMESKPPSKVTLSGLLNFTDGLWSCCGEERIFVFTTNHKERLDPALLRSGRMDFHILLSYCTFAAFKVLAANYLGLQEHDLYEKLEEQMRNSKLTPAEVVELLISNKHKPEAALYEVIAALKDSDPCKGSSTTLDEPPPPPPPPRHPTCKTRQSPGLKKTTNSSFKAILEWSPSFKKLSLVLGSKKLESAALTKSPLSIFSPRTPSSHRTPTSHRTHRTPSSHTTRCE